MKVLHVLWSGHVSGAEKIVVNVSKEIRRKFGIVSSVVCLEDDNKEPSLEKVLRKSGIETFTSRRVPRDFIKTVKSSIRRFQPDIIHSHDYKASIATLLAMGFFKKRNLKHVTHIHATYPFMEKINLKSIAGFFALLLSQSVFVVSEAVLNNMWFKKIISHKVKIIPNPYLGDTSPLPFEKAVDMKEFDMIFLGRLVPEKHPEKFCEVCEKLNLKCIVVGSGPLESELIKEYGGKVAFLGYRDNVEEWLRKSKFLFLPSEHEGFGLVVIEALINYCIPIVTPWKGVEYIIKQGKTGYIVSHDPETSSDEIKRLLEEFDDIFPRFYRVRERVIQEYSLDRYINELMKFYKDIIHTI
jgi:glycosyltransferase involved in cell wall biosynthesis